MRKSNLYSNRGYHNEMKSIRDSLHRQGGYPYSPSILRPPQKPVQLKGPIQDPIPKYYDSTEEVLQQMLGYRPQGIHFLGSQKSEDTSKSTETQSVGSSEKNAEQQNHFNSASFETEHLQKDLAAREQVEAELEAEGLEGDDSKEEELDADHLDEHLNEELESETEGEDSSDDSTEDQEQVFEQSNESEIDPSGEEAEGESEAHFVDEDKDEEEKEKDKDAEDGLKFSGQWPYVEPENEESLNPKIAKIYEILKGDDEDEDDDGDVESKGDSDVEDSDLTDTDSDVEYETDSESEGADEEYSDAEYELTGSELESDYEGVGSDVGTGSDGAEYEGDSGGDSGGDVDYGVDADYDIDYSDVEYGDADYGDIDYGMDMDYGDFGDLGWE